MSLSNLAVSTESKAIEGGQFALPEPSSVRTAKTSEAFGVRALNIFKWIFSFPVMLGMTLVGAAFCCARAFNVDPDLWWHVKAGQAILATHHWPTSDIYSFTVHGQPWIAYEWGGEVLTGLASRIGGLQGLDLLLMAMGAAVLGALYVLGTVRSGNSKAGFLAAVVLSPIAIISFTLRPQMAGYLFLILTLIALELFRQGTRWAVWFLPVLMLAWVNTHGSFIIGLGAIFLYWVCGLVEFRKGAIEAKRWSIKDRRSLSLVFLLCLAVLPITPYGSQLAVYPFSMAFSQPLNVANVQEWQPMQFHLLIGKVFLALVLGFFVLQMVYDFKWRIEELLLFLGGVTMAFLHSRFILLFVPFTAPLLAVIAARWMDGYSRAKDKYALNVIVMAAVVISMVHYFPSQRSLEAKTADVYPVEAVAYLRQHPVPGPMFNTYGFGGYLVGADYKTFIDGRGDLFERGGVFQDYLQLMDLKPGGLDVLRRYRIESCLVESHESLATVLLASPEWKRVYVDKVSALFVRVKPLEPAPKS